MLLFVSEKICFEVVEIKKLFILGLIFIVIIFCLFTGCNNRKGGKISLLKTPIADEQLYKVNKDKVKIVFELPCDGYLKLLAYDNTAYPEMPEEIFEIKARILDKKGKVLYDNLYITNGYIDKCLLKEGKASVEITAKNMDEIAFSWAFAPKYETIPELKENKTSVARVDKKADFKLSVQKSGIYNIECAEACMSEYDCNFTVLNSENKPMADKLFIHSNEWNSRKVFLPKGEYKIMVEDVFAVASCTVKPEKIFENIALENDENMKLPLQIGFLKDGNNSVTAQFESQNGKIVATVVGTDTYYDSQQGFKIEISDKNGNVLLSEEYEGSMEWNIPENFGKGFVKVVLNENGVVNLTLN